MLSVVPTLSSVPPKVRQRAAAIVVHHGRVLLHRVEGDGFWALPGGAIEPGESASEALSRELREELGESVGACVTVGALAVVAENFFTYAGAEYHEIGLYLHASPLPASVLTSTDGPYDGVEGTRKLVFAWFTRAELARLEIRPAFLQAFLGDLLAEEPTGVLHIVHRDPPASKDTGAAPQANPTPGR